MSRRPGLRPRVRRSVTAWAPGRRHWVMECPGCNRDGVTVGRYLRTWTHALDAALVHAAECVNLDPSTRRKALPWL